MVYLVLIIALVMGVMFFMRCLLLKKALRQTVLELKEIQEHIEDNRILKVSMPDSELESLYIAINDMLKEIRFKHISYEKREKEFQKQIENISHDLRTPLTSILGYLKTIDLRALGQEDQESLEVIRRKSETMQILVSQFYDLSRIGTDNYEMELSNVDIRRMLREVVVDYYQELFQNGIEAKLDLPEKPIYTRGNKEAIERIFSNLLQNACRYADKTVWIKMEKDQRTIRVIFENYAKGLSREQTKRLFDRFYINEEARSQGGTGLGLTISKNLAEKMGGTLGAKLSDEKLLSITFELRNV